MIQYFILTIVVLTKRQISFDNIWSKQMRLYDKIVYMFGN